VREEKREIERVKILTFSTARRVVVGNSGASDLGGIIPETTKRV